MNLLRTTKKIITLGAIVGSFYLGGTEEGILARRYIENFNKDFANYSYQNKTGPLLRTYEGVGGTEWRLYDPSTGTSRIVHDDLTARNWDPYMGANKVKEVYDWATSQSENISDKVGEKFDELTCWGYKKYKEWFD